MRDAWPQNWHQWCTSERDDGDRGAAMRKIRKHLYRSVTEEMAQVSRTGAIHFSDSEGNRWERSLDGGLSSIQFA